MGRPKSDLTGQKHGLWTVIRYSRQSDAAHYHRHLWLVRCKCGTERELGTSAISRSKSCGCNRNVTHGMCDHPDYPVWSAMWNRVRNPNGEDWLHYGGRGITVCDRWKWFPYFVEDMGPRTSKTETIERLNVNGNYEPANCCWLENKLQAINRTNSRLITIEGETKCISEWSKHYGVSDSLMRLRIFRDGMDPQSALTTPTGRTRKDAVYMEIDGISKPLVAWCQEYNAPLGLVRQRVKKGWEPLKALTTPSIGSNDQRKQNHSPSAR